MDQTNHNDIEQIEINTRTQLHTLTGGDPKKKEAISAFLDELNIIFVECKEWMKTNMDPEVLEPRIQKLKADTEVLVHKAKEQVQIITERPDVKEKLQEGKEMVLEVSSKVVKVISDGTQELLRQENVKNVVDNVSDKVSSIRNDVRLKEGVTSLKKGTLKVAENAFYGLKKILDDETTDEHEQ